jgi:ABC-type multidrug transport system ATPase subunit
LLERVGLAGSADRRVATFTRGMKSRLGLARAMLHRPRALFLDEPTAGLDPEGLRGMLDLIREQKRSGCAVFLATRDPSIAGEICDRVALIADGIVPARGRGSE